MKPKERRKMETGRGSQYENEKEEDEEGTIQSKAKRKLAKKTGEQT